MQEMLLARLVLKSLECEDNDKDRALLAKAVAGVHDMMQSPRTALAFGGRADPGDAPAQRWNMRQDPAKGTVLDVVYCTEVPFRKAEVDVVLQRLREQNLPNNRKFDPRVRVLSGS